MSPGSTSLAGVNDTDTDRSDDALPDVVGEQREGRADAAQEGSSSSAGSVTGVQALAMADPSRVRRAPRFARIGLVSALIGLLACAVATVLFAEPTEFISLPGVFLLISVAVVPVFVFAGCALALVLDARSRRQRRRRNR